MYLEQITPLILPNYRIMITNCLFAGSAVVVLKNLFWIKYAECRIVKLSKLAANLQIESESKNTDEVCLFNFYFIYVPEYLSMKIETCSILINSCVHLNMNAVYSCESSLTCVQLSLGQIIHP